MDTKKLNDELTAAVTELENNAQSIYKNSDANEEARELMKRTSKEVIATLDSFRASIINALNEK